MIRDTIHCCCTLFMEAFEKSSSSMTSRYISNVRHHYLEEVFFCEVQIYRSPSFSFIMCQFVHGNSYNDEQKITWTFRYNQSLSYIISIFSKNVFNQLKHFYSIFILCLEELLEILFSKLLQRAHLPSDPE